MQVKLLHKAVLALFMELKLKVFSCFDSLQKSLAVTGRKMNRMRKWVLHVGTWSRNLARKQKHGLHERCVVYGDPRFQQKSLN